MTNNINGIDVSECSYFNSVTYEEPYCNIDQEHLYTCSSDENCYFKQFKRLQEENEELKKYIQRMDKPEIKTIDSEIALKNIELQKENEELKEEIHATRNNRLKMYESFETECNNYKQALEEIRKEANRLLYEENPIYGYNNSNYFEILAKYVLAKTKEALNDRD